MATTIYASKPLNGGGNAQIENGGYLKYALMVNGQIIAQSDDWDHIKAKYDSYK